MSTWTDDRDGIRQRLQRLEEDNKNLKLMVINLLLALSEIDLIKKSGYIAAIQRSQEDLHPRK